MSLLFERKSSNKACSRSRASCNRANVSCPSGIARMSRFLEQFPSVPLNLEPSTHLPLAQQPVRDAAALAFSAQKDFVKKPRLSSLTVEVLRSKVRLSRTCIYTAFFLRNANVRACFYLWRGWRSDHSRTIYCSVRGFSAKHLCFKQILGLAAERTKRAQLVLFWS